MRITASWSGVLRPPNTRMWHESFVHHMRAPLDVVIPTTRKCAVVLGAVKARPGHGGRRKRRPALTAPARAGVSILRSGRGKACGAVELEK